MTNITDHALALDSFLNPVTYKGRSAIEVLLCRLILLEPGTIQTHPNMGVGIVSRYRNAPSSELAVLDDDIKNQINTYLPGLVGVEVKTNLVKNGVLRIAIKANDQLFALTYDSSNTSLNSEKLSLESLV